MEEYYSLLSASDLFYGLTSEELGSMLHCLGAKIVDTQKGDPVFLEGDPAGFVGIVLEGSIQVVQEDYFGSRSVIHHSGPGDVFAEAFSFTNLDTMPVSGYAVKNSANPLCYNGDILSLEQAHALQHTYPQIQSVMIGRGLIADPGMLEGGTDKAALEGFMNELMAVYEVEFGGSRNAIFRLKENWGFLHSRFEGCDKLWKRLRKTTDAAEFKAITAEIFHTLPLK